MALMFSAITFLLPLGQKKNAQLMLNQSGEMHESRFDSAFVSLEIEGQPRKSSLLDVGN